MSTPGVTVPGARIALFLPSLAGGGVGRSFLSLARGFRDAGHRVDLLLCRRSGPLLGDVPDGVRVIELAAENELRARARLLALDPGGAARLLRPVLLARRGAVAVRHVAALAAYLRETRPAALLAGKTHCNLAALWAQRLAGGDTRVVVSERTQLSHSIAGSRRWRWRHVAPLLERWFPAAHAVTAVSAGVRAELLELCALGPAQVHTLPNPVVTPELRALQAAPSGHAWLDEPGPPVILGVGRLAPQKNFPLLLEAFAALARQHAEPLRLLILGEGRERAALEQQATRLGIAGQVALPGFSPNPHAYMARARLFVLSSDYEGLPGVLIQALASGCPVVSTDCPSGPREILEAGRHGRLVPVGDAAALRAAMAAALAEPPDAAALRASAQRYSLASATQQHLELLLPAQAAAPDSCAA